MRAVSLWNHRLEEKKKLFTKNLATAVDVRYAAVAAKACVLSRIFYYHVRPNMEVEWWLLDAWIMNWLVGKTDIMSKPRLSQKTKVTHSVWSQILGGQVIHNQTLFQTILNSISILFLLLSLFFTIMTAMKMRMPMMKRDQWVFSSQWRWWSGTTNGYFPVGWR